MHRKLRLKKGETITHDGQDLELTSPLILRYKTIPTGDTIAASSVKGERSSDEVRAIDQATVLSIIKKEIDRLEIKENDMLMSAAGLDGLGLDDDASFSDHLGTAQQIMNLRKILKQVKAL